MESAASGGTSPAADPNFFSHLIPPPGGGVGSAGVPVASGNSRRPLLSRREGLSLETLSATLDCSRIWLRRPEVPGNVPSDPGPQEQLGQPRVRPLKYPRQPFALTPGHPVYQPAFLPPFLFPVSHQRLGIRCFAAAPVWDGMDSRVKIMHDEDSSSSDIYQCDQCIHVCRRSI